MSADELVTEAEHAMSELRGATKLFGLLMENADLSRSTLVIARDAVRAMHTRSLALLDQVDALAVDLLR